MLAGYQSHDHRYETYHHTHAPDDDPGTNGPSLSHMGHEGHDSPVIFKFHRHSSEEGYHLHGSIDAEHFLDEDHRRDDAKGRAHTHNVSGTLQSSWQNINHPVLPRPNAGTVSPHVSADHNPSSASEACFYFWGEIQARMLPGRQERRHRHAWRRDNGWLRNQGASHMCRKNNAVRLASFQRCSELRPSI